MGVRGLVGAAVAAWVVVGCGAAEMQEPVSSSMETITAAVQHGNGPVLNGISPNGITPNGITPNGISPNGTLMNRTVVAVRYDGVSKPGMGTPFQEVWLQGSTFHGLRDSEELSGLDFQHTVFTGDLDDGSALTLRIDSITQGSGADQDVWSYGVSYQNAQDGQWHSLCTAADGTAAAAIPLEGVWNYGQGVSGGGSKLHSTTAFTFACDGFALAKCARFGYAPWRTVNGVSLEGHHAACTRLLRADYCGDGTPHTVDGNLVNIYDTLDVQADTESWQAEAEWTATGASCFTSHNRSSTQIQCADGRLVSTCAQDFSAGTLIISETP